MKCLQERPQHPKIIEAMATIKLQESVCKGFFPLATQGKLMLACTTWSGDEKVHFYCTVDAGTRVVLVEHVEKEETPMGYFICLKKLLLKHGKSRLIVADKRKSFWNGHESKNQSALICNALGIEVVSSSEPTAKPNVERSFLDAQQWCPLLLFGPKIFNCKDFKCEITMLTTLHHEQFQKSLGPSPFFIYFCAWAINWEEWQLVHLSTSY